MAESQQQTQPQQGGGAGSALAFGLTGGQIPFGNVITSGIGAGIAKAAGVDHPFGELYQQAQDYTKATKEAHPSAYTAGNVAGLATTLPLAFSKGLTNAIEKMPVIGNIARAGAKKISAGPIEATARLGIRSGKGAALATGGAGLYAAGEADAGQRMAAAKEVIPLAAGIGAAMPVAGAGLGLAASKIVPKIDEGLKDTAILAKKYNIPLSFDQVTKSRPLKNIQKVSQELPFSGEAGFREKQLSSWQKSLLKTVGLNADKFTKINMDKAFINVGKEFDDLGKGKTFQFGDDFLRSLDEIRENAASTHSKDAIENFNNTIQNFVLKNADGQGKISGELLGKVRAKVNELARKSNNPDTQDLLHDLENAIIDTMTAGDDIAKGAFSATKKKYKNLLVLEPLAAKAKGGNISPSQLNSRVSKIYGRAHTRGKAGEIGELAQIGFELLPELGGSDTTQKLLYGVGGISALGATVANPAVGLPAMGLAGLGLTANRAMQSGLMRNQKLMNKSLMKEILQLPPAEAKKLLEGK